MLSPVHLNRSFVIAGSLALFGLAAILQAQTRRTNPHRHARERRPRWRRRRAIQDLSRDAIDRGLPAYNSTCGYCHGERGKGGKAGPDLIASLVTLHDEDGVQLAKFVRATGALESRQDRYFGQLRSPTSPPTCIRA